MTIEIDQSVWDHWENGDHDGEIALLVTSSTSAATLARMITSISIAIDPADGFNVVLARAAVVTPAGVGMRIIGGADLHTLLDPLAAQLTAAGIDAVVSNHTENVPPLPGMHEVPFLEARLALAATPVDGFAWTVAPPIIDAVVRHGVAWAAADGGELAGYSGVWWSAPDADQAAEALLPLGEGRLTAGSGGRFRCFDCAPWLGYADFTIGTPPTEADFDSLIGLLRDVAPQGTYGFVRASRNPVAINADWYSNASGRPTTMNRDPDWVRVEQAAPLPVAGVQLAHLASGTDLPRSRWEVHPLGELSLIVARDLQPWLTGTADLEQAAADLTGIGY